jgi:hypothetical protein
MMTRFLTTILMMVVAGLHAQDDLLKELEGKAQSQDQFVLGTFKGTRVVNGHSIETKRRGELEFMINHRFGTLNSGGYNLWGLDEANIRLGLEYGINDWFTLGIGRSSADKTFDGYLKYKALRQRIEGFPFTVTLQGTAAYQASYLKEFEEASAQDAMAFSAQALFARKFNFFSLQIAPTILHRNTVDQDIAVNTLFALGLGARVKVTRSFAIHAEYYPRLNEKGNNPFHNAVGLGFDIETGGHVFQLLFTNSIGMTDRIYLAETEGSISNGDIRFGFNITRTFQVVKSR